jgi:uncharacterized RDD family membrane protein YckC
MECRSCHANNVERASFCSSCGTSLTSARASAALADSLARLGAAIVDGIVLVVPVGVFAVVIPLLAHGPGGETVASVFILLSLLIGLMFHMVLLTKDGQTFGKKALGIRIVKMNTGENGGFAPNVLLRLIANGLIGIIPFYGLVDILFIFRSGRRCIHA